MFYLKRKAISLAAAVIFLHACALGAHGRQSEQDEAQRIFLPGANSALDINVRGFSTPLWDFSNDNSSDAKKSKAGGAAAQTRREFRSMLMPVKSKPPRLGFLLIRMEAALTAGGAEAMVAAALASYPKLKHVKEDSLKQSEYKQTPLLRYSFEGFPPQEGTFLSYVGSGNSAFPIPYSLPGMPKSLHVLESYFVRDGTWITVRLTMNKLGDEEEKIFYSLLDSVQFFDAANPSSSYDYFTLGNERYRLKEHGEAIALLEKSLDLERKQRTLTQSQWRLLIMTLANAHGAVDRAERAREVLEYGVATDPTFAYFHHGLSRLHSYFGDLDRVLAELELAYQYEPRNEKGFVGWPIPDPFKDPAFQKYKDDPKFRDAVKALKKKHNIKN